MSYNNSSDEESVQPARTIAERVKRGKATGRLFDGAIVPFPEGMTADDLVAALTGDAKARVDRLLFAGCKTTVYEYRSAEGELIQAVLRFDHPGGDKEFKPVRFVGELPGKGRVIMLKALDRPWPLYGLDRLAARPDAAVLAVEGEKAANAAQAQFPDLVVITWPSGAGNARNVELLALAGRQLILWPDNDPPGKAAMRTFAAAAYDAGASSVRVVDVPVEFGEKWDLADPIPSELADTHDVGSLLDAARPITAEEVAHLKTEAGASAERRRLLGHKPGYSRVEPEHVQTALEALDPDMFGNKWRRVARCIFYALAERGLTLFNSWSQGSSKYRFGEPARLWLQFAARSTFRADPLAWLFNEARKALLKRAQAASSDKPNVEISAEAIKIAAIEQLNEDHAVVLRGGKAAVLREYYDPRYQAFTQTYLSKRDLVDLYVNLIELPGDDELQNAKRNKKVRQGELWFSSPRRRSYDGVFFAPGQTLGPRYLNTFRGFTVEPRDDLEGWSKLKHHLFNHVAGCDQEHYDYLLNWLACAVQRLDRPMLTALVLLGPKGAGKSIIIELFGHLFGQHKFVTSRMDDVTGRFNDRLETTLLLGLEEAVAPQNRAADGTLKDLITRRSLRLEGKFFGVWDAPNHLRIIVTSNNEHVIRADGHERRYAAFDVKNPHQSDPDGRRAYFGSMVKQMETGGFEAMLGELLDRDITNWNPENLPETAALRRQKELNLINDPVRSFLFERLTDGINITTGDSGHAVPIHLWDLTADVMVPARDLIEDYKCYCEANQLPFSHRRLAMQLRRYMRPGFETETLRGPDINGTSRQFKAYRFPPLEEARSLFEKATGLIIDRGEGRVPDVTELPS